MFSDRIKLKINNLVTNFENSKRFIECLKRVRLDMQYLHYTSKFESVGTTRPIGIDSELQSKLVSTKTNNNWYRAEGRVIIKQVFFFGVRGNVVC